MNNISIIIRILFAVTIFQQPLDEIDRSTLVLAMCDVMMLPVAWSVRPWHGLRTIA
jgi:hypothetical protein